MVHVKQMSGPLADYCLGRLGALQQQNGWKQILCTHPAVSRFVHVTLDLACVRHQIFHSPVLQCCGVRGGEYGLYTEGDECKMIKNFIFQWQKPEFFCFFFFFKAVRLTVCAPGGCAGPEWRARARPFSLRWSREGWRRAGSTSRLPPTRLASADWRRRWNGQQTLRDIFKKKKHDYKDQHCTPLRTSWPAQCLTF